MVTLTLDYRHAHETRVALRGHIREMAVGYKNVPDSYKVYLAKAAEVYAMLLGKPIHCNLKLDEVLFYDKEFRFVDKDGVITVQPRKVE